MGRRYSIEVKVTVTKSGALASVLVKYSLYFQQPTITNLYSLVLVLIVYPV